MYWTRIKFTGRTMQRLPNVEDNYEDFRSPENDTQERVLRTKCVHLLKALRINSHSKLVFRILKAKNNLVLTEETNKRMRKGNPAMYSFRILPEEKTLMFARIDTRIQVKACWWEDCQRSTSGDNDYLLCQTHAVSYVEMMNEKILNNLQINVPDGSQELLHIRSRFVHDKLVDMRRDDCRLIEKTVDVFTVACVVLFWSPTNNITFDPLTQMSDNKRKNLIAKLSGSYFQYKDLMLTFNKKKSTFMIMDLTQEVLEWKSICNHDLGCFVLSYQTFTRCLDHHVEENDWGTQCAQKCKEIARMDNSGSTDYDSLIKAVSNSKCKKIDIDERTYICLAKDAARLIAVRINIRKYRVCPNKECFHPSVSVDEVRACPKCNYLKMHTAALLFFPNVENGIYFSVQFSHLNTEFEQNIDFRKVAHKTAEKMKGERLGKDFEIVRMQHCFGGKAEAQAWQMGFILYTKFEAYHFGKRAKFCNAMPPIKCKFWNVFKTLCAENGLYLSSTTKTVIPPIGYRILSEHCHFSNNDFTKTTYRIKIGELVYIGQRTIYAPSGRQGFISAKHHLTGRNHTSAKVILERLRNEGFGDEIPCEYVTATTICSISQYLPESMVLLAYTVNIQILGNESEVLVNDVLSTTELSEKWIEDLQAVGMVLFGKSFEINNADNLTLENSLIFNKKGSKGCE